MKKNAYIAALCLMFGCILASARDNALEHAVGVNVRPSYIVPTHGLSELFFFIFSGISSRKHVSGSLSGGRYWCADRSGIHTLLYSHNLMFGVGWRFLRNK